MRATRIATLTGQGIGYLLVLSGVALMVLGYWVSGLWPVFVGVFLRIAASASYRQAILRDNLQGFTAQDLMTTDCQTVSAELSIEALVSEYILPAGHQCLLVGEWGRVKGVITPQDIRRVPKRRWNITAVAEVMTPVEKLGNVSPGDDGLAVLEIMGEGRIGVLPVVSGDGMVGVIERDRLLQLTWGRS
jgi:predicted transcriptional regulator